jgi:4-hydroxy-tetrahydrodipicolinate reductase
VISVCIAGATGWTGRALVPAVVDASDLELVSSVNRSAAGRDLGEALSGDALGVPVYATVAEALDGVDVLVDYTSATAVKGNVTAAVAAGVGVVVGSSGLTAGDFAEVDMAARERRRRASVRLSVRVPRARRPGRQETCAGRRARRARS